MKSVDNFDAMGFETFMEEIASQDTEKSRHLKSAFDGYYVFCID